MIKSKTVSAHSGMMMALGLVLILALFLGMSYGVEAKVSILDVDVTYEKGTGPAESTITLDAEAQGNWSPTDKKNNKLAAAPACTDKDFVFLYWRDVDGKVYEEESVYPEENTLTDNTKLTFTAVWGVMATYNTNLSGEIVSPTGFEAGNPEYKTEYLIPEANVLTNTNYDFLGWSTKSNLPYAKSATVQTGDYYKVGSKIAAADVTDAFTLYAVWQAKFFSVTYFANTGSDSGDGSVTVPKDTTKYMGTNLNATVMGNGNLANTNTNYATMTDAKPTRTGYTFAGWATSSTATAAQYMPGATFEVTKDMSLYAVWKTTTASTTNGTSGTTSTTTATTKTPQTGAEDYLTLYAVIAIFSLVGIGYLCIDRRKVKGTK